MDLLDWSPLEIVHRFSEDRICASSLRARIARAVAEALKDSEKSREDTAAAMTEWLGEDVSVHMLNAWASQAREDHSIPYQRLLALVHVTGDVRLLQLGAEMFGHSVVDDRYLPWVEVGQLADQRDAVERAFETARRTARKGGGR